MTTIGERAGPAGAEGAAPGRTAWPDAVRVGLTALVIAHHCAITYSHIPAWTYYEPPTDGTATLLDAFVATNQAWFMGAFFLISGWFVPGSVDRHGVAGFVRGRLLRLGLPFLAFLLVLKPVFYLPLFAGQDGAWLQAFLAPDPGPLWFVLLLLVFSLVYALVRGVREARPVGTGPVPGVLAVAGAGLALGAATWAWWIVVPNGTFWAVLPSAGYLPQYALCFVIGIVGGRRGWFERLRPRTGWACAALAVVTGLAWLTVAVLGGGAAAGGGTAVSAVAAVLNGLFTVFVIVAVLVAARRWLDRSGPVARFLSTNAFAVFVLHPPIVAWLGVALAGFAAPAAAKALVLFALAAPLCWAAAWSVRRIAVVRRVV
ncbi:acyltransferase family protein [Pseudonocardia parietis]|uniref:Fucose 4-O-acetylase-like acetyltransferase n=1 Tax=Pseudonocardia parietis TaxID=570936 RepID=A0ABS4VVW6_9PSEU|nr:acyltransferase [Pseudonocardia parietis]MBP2368067.1 fucose 4-O-acetylase-like acetyltransferase [Pseudonocardia parietis]